MKTKNWRSPKHLEWLREQRCLCCNRCPRSEAAHIRIGTDGGMGLKPSDYWATPLCSECHGYQHLAGERTFWTIEGLDPHKEALRLVRLGPDGASAIEHWEGRGHG